MAKIGSEIIQTRTFPELKKEPPNLDYKLTYPITVYQAVREDINDEKSETLDKRLERIEGEIRNRQELIPNQSPDNIMTFSGKVGVIGSIRITTKILAAMNEESDERIPTEKAVGDLLRKLGLVTNEGGVTGNNGPKIIWDAVVDKPEVHDELGTDSRGYISQAAMTEIIKDIKSDVAEVHDSELFKDFEKHEANTDNPHKITPEKIDAVSNENFSKHADSHANPHQVTKNQIGLDKVDNTSDAEKPLTKEAKERFQELETKLAVITGEAAKLKFITDLEYKQKQGKLEFTLSDNSIDSVKIVTDPLIEKISLDKEQRGLRIQTLGGSISTVSFKDIFAEYTGDESEDIIVEVDDDHVITAKLKDKSIYTDELGDGVVTDKKLAYNSVDSPHLKDHAVTAPKILHGAVTSDKLDDQAVTAQKLANHAVTSQKIEDYAVTDKKIKEDAVTTKKIRDEAVTNEKIKDNTITGDKIKDKSIGPDKLVGEIITTEKLADNSVTSDKLADGLEFQNPHLESTPEGFDDHAIPDMQWVKQFIQEFHLSKDNFLDKSIPVEKLQTDIAGKKVLGVTRPIGTPVWTKIIAGMLDTNSVATPNLQDGSVTREKLADGSISGNQIESGSITKDHIAEGQVTSDELFSSEEPNRVLGVGKDPGHPQYTKVTAEMINIDAVQRQHIKDHSVSLAKLEPPFTEDNVTILFDTAKMLPTYGKVDTKYIADHAITPEKFYRPDDQNVVLAVKNIYSNPEFTKITNAMLSPDFHFEPEQIGDNSVFTNHLRDKSVTTDKLADHVITFDKLALENPDNLSAVVLGIEKKGTTPVYTKVQNEMLEPKSITPDKLFTSDNDHSVIGVRKIGQEPQYVKISNPYLADHTITGDKLYQSITLPGKPRTGENPPANSDSTEIATTAWVRELLDDSGIETADEIIRTLNEQTVPVENIVRSAEPNMVLATVSKFENVKYTKVTREMLADDITFNSNNIEPGSITLDKLADQSIPGNLLTENSVTSEKLSRDLSLPSETETELTHDVYHPFVRNIYAGRSIPTEARPGDVFFLF